MLLKGYNFKQMKDKKDITELFKSNQDKLNRRPSKQAWRRLEARLEAHQSRNRLSFIRHLSMAAAVAALVALIFAVSIFMDQPQSNMALHETEESLHFVLEDLNQQDADEAALQVVEFTRHYQDRMSNPIEEGDHKKKIVAATEKE